MFGNPTLNRRKLKIRFNFRCLDIFFHVIPELYFSEQQSSFTAGTFSNSRTTDGQQGEPENSGGRRRLINSSYDSAILQLLAVNIHYTK